MSFPDKIIELINTPGLPIALGTRDENLQPAASYIMGVKLDEGNKVSFHYQKSLGDKHLNDLLENGNVAITISHPVTHSSFQLKGKYLSHREGNQEDQKKAKAFLDSFINNLTPAYGEAPSISAYSKDDGSCYVVTITVEEMYNQTPGPNAGQKID